MRFSRWCLLLLLLPAAALPFGKNKITYDRFHWRVYSSTHFRVHYYPEEAAVLEKVVSMAESAYDRLSKKMNTTLDKPVPLIIYRTHAEFEETNVLEEFIPEGIGAFAEPVRNRMVMPVDLPDERLQKLILHEMTHIFQFAFFFQGAVGKALLNPAPQWFMEGMASYLADDENAMARMFLRDFVVNDRIPPISSNGVGGYMAYRFGHAVFTYIEETYGLDGFRRLLYEYRTNLEGTLEKPIKRAFDVEPREFDRAFRLWIRKRYLPSLSEWGEPEQYGRPLFTTRALEGVHMLSPVLFPSGELVAGVTTLAHDVGIAVFTVKGSRVFRNLTPGLIHRFDYLSSQYMTTGPEMGRDLDVSPDGNTIAFFGRKDKDKHLFLISTLNGRIVLEQPLPVDQPLSPVFSPDGATLVFSGVKGSRADLFQYRLSDRSFVNLTDDAPFDGSPAFSPDGKTLVYSSYVGGEAQLFLMDLGDPAHPRKQITWSEGNHMDAVFSPDGKGLYYTWDRDDYPNIYRLDLETSTTEQITAAGTGCFQPYVRRLADGKDLLIFSGFFKGVFGTYRVEKPRALASFDETPRPAGKEAKPFEPEITVPLDLTKGPEPYKPRMALSFGSISAGVSSDQQFIGLGYLRFSDLIGNRFFTFSMQSVSTYSNLTLDYLDLSHRGQWGWALYDVRTYYLLPSTEGSNRADREQDLRYTGGYLFWQYPFSTYRRFSLGVGYDYWSENYPIAVPGPGGTTQYDFVKFSESFPFVMAAFNGDTVVWQEFGPLAGSRYQLGYTISPRFSGGPKFTRTELDYRHYFPITERSLVAWRLVGMNSGGESPYIFTFGGLDTMRGYDYQAFFGTQGFYTNLELRFPLLDALVFPFGAFEDIRGRVFLDMGGAWFEGQTFQLMEDHRLKDGRSTYGFGFTVRFLGLDWNWDWATRWDLKESTGGRNYSFWIGYTF